jgi:hypothetical protein
VEKKKRRFCKVKKTGPPLARTWCAGRHRADLLIKVPTAKFRTWPWKVEFLRRGYLHFSAGVPRIGMRKGKGIEFDSARDFGRWNSFGEDVCGYLQVFRGFGCGKGGVLIPN